MGEPAGIELERGLILELNPKAEMTTSQAISSYELLIVLFSLYYLEKPGFVGNNFSTMMPFISFFSLKVKQTGCMLYIFVALTKFKSVSNSYDIISGFSPHVLPIGF